MHHPTLIASRVAKKEKQNTTFELIGEKPPKAQGHRCALRNMKKPRLWVLMWGIVLVLVFAAGGFCTYLAFVFDEWDRPLIHSEAAVREGIESLGSITIPPEAKDLAYVLNWDELFIHMSISEQSRDDLVTKWLGHPKYIRELEPDEMSRYSPSRERWTNAYWAKNHNLAQLGVVSFTNPVGYGASVKEGNPRLFKVAIYERDGTRLLLYLNTD